MKEAAAKNPSTPAATLVALASSPSLRLRSAAAQNPALPSDVLLVLVDDDSTAVRSWAAGNACARRDLIPVLAGSPHADVRESVAHAIEEPQWVELDIQLALSRDESREVRAQVGRFTEYRAVFDALLGDAHPDVRGTCAANPRLTREDAELLLGDRSWNVRAHLAARGVLFPDDEQLMRLARDKSLNVHWAVMMRVGCPREAVEIIAQDDDPTNSEQAAFV